MTISNDESFKGSMSEEDRRKICRIYKESKKHGGWKGPNLQQVAEAVDRSEEVLRRQLRDIYSWGWGETCVTERGEVVRSDLEKQVADFLYNSETRYQYEPDVRSKYVPDFLLENGVAVEVWGVKNDPEYTRKRAQKEEWYAKSPWGLVSLEPSDVPRLDEIFPINSRKAGIVQYASEGLIPLQNFNSFSSSTSVSDDSLRGREIQTDDPTRQLMLDGRPKQAVFSDFTANGPWWDGNEEPSI